MVKIITILKDNFNFPNFIITTKIIITRPIVMVMAIKKAKKIVIIVAAMIKIVRKRMNFIAKLDLLKII